MYVYYTIMLLSIFTIIIIITQNIGNSTHSQCTVCSYTNIHGQRLFDSHS